VNVNARFFVLSFALFDCRIADARNQRYFPSGDATAYRRRVKQEDSSRVTALGRRAGSIIFGDSGCNG